MFVCFLLYISFIKLSISFLPLLYSVFTSHCVGVPSTSVPGFDLFELNLWYSEAPRYRYLSLWINAKMSFIQEVGTSAHRRDGTPRASHTLKFVTFIRVCREILCVVWLLHDSGVCFSLGVWNRDFVIICEWCSVKYFVCRSVFVVIWRNMGNMHGYKSPWDSPEAEPGTTRKRAPVGTVWQRKGARMLCFHFCSFFSIKCTFISLFLYFYIKFELSPKFFL